MIACIIEQPAISEILDRDSSRPKANNLYQRDHVRVQFGRATE
jgi:hypothetical protein